MSLTGFRLGYHDALTAHARTRATPPTACTLAHAPTGQLGGAHDSRFTAARARTAAAVQTAAAAAAAGNAETAAVQLAAAAAEGHQQLIAIGLRRAVRVDVGQKSGTIPPPHTYHADAYCIFHLPS